MGVSLAVMQAASDRVLQLEQETADRLGSIEKAYEMLKRSDRERLETMQREVEQLRRSVLIICKLLERFGTESCTSLAQKGDTSRM